jgi:hypothetical protein
MREYNFKPGNTFGNGRPPGSRNVLSKDFYEAYERCKTRDGYKHPIELMMDIIYDQTQSTERRDAMLFEALRILTPKKLELALDIDFPSVQSPEQGESFLSVIIDKLGPELEPLQLATLVRMLIDSKRNGQELELKLATANQGPEQTIHITGGLPDIPGTNIIMPGQEPHQLNGHASVASQTAPAPQIESTKAPED